MAKNITPIERQVDMIQLSVATSKKYNILMEQGLLADAGKHISALMVSLSSLPGQSSTTGPKKKICIVTDITVNSLYGGESHKLQTSLLNAGFDVYTHVFPGGEDFKTFDTVTSILDYLAKNKFSRSDLLLALGGGIVGDVTGFAASVYLRGIDYIQVPTTLLAIVDSSVGGKTGVNLKAGKNLAGVFWQPALVLFDYDVLSTLSYELKMDGFSEAIKAGAIADKTIIDSMDVKASLKNPDYLMDIIARSINVKIKAVEEDERDNGSRQLLNFGHTVAHAIEKCSNYRISHGHAVAMGMIIVSNAADKLGWTRENCREKLMAVLQSFNFPLTCNYSAKKLADAALQDKKIRGDNITIVVPDFIGKCVLKKIPIRELAPFIASGLEDFK